MPKVKVCGITNLQDAELAIEQGIWALGFIFVENTPRYIQPEKASEITAKLPDEIEKVGVFANSELKDILEISQIANLTKIQLHGEESPEFCRELKEKSSPEIIKAFRIKTERDIYLIESYKYSVDYVLLDSFSEKSLGGTGKTFNWNLANLARKKYNLPIILAGGLNHENIQNALDSVNPYALDLSSGLEKEKGKKDPEKLKKLGLFISK